MGAHVNEVFLYEAISEVHISQAILNEIKNGVMDYITFTSSSTVTNFVKIIGREHVNNINQRVKVACIGPITADTAREAGFKVDIVAKEYTIQGLINAIIDEM